MTRPQSESGHALFELAIKLVIVQDGKILLLRRPGVAGAFWDLPGGRTLPYERFETTIARELREEIGSAADVVCVRLLDVGLWTYPGACPKILHYYQARVDARVEVVLSPEHVGFAWIEPHVAALDALDEARLEPELRAVLLRCADLVPAAPVEEPPLTEAALRAIADLGLTSCDFVGDLGCTDDSCARCHPTMSPTAQGASSER